LPALQRFGSAASEGRRERDLADGGISTPALSQEAGYVTPNVNTLYGFGFLDLAAEPIILSVPDSHGRYYMIEIVDFWTNAFAYAGGVATGYKGGKFALVGPGWKGRLPPHVTRIDSPTRWILVQPRVHVVNRDDLPAARAVLDAITRSGARQSDGEAVAGITTPHQNLLTRSCPSAHWLSRTRFSSGRFSPTP
jgi:hypothetical protein